jgi:hypothetical protein
MPFLEQMTAYCRKSGFSISQADEKSMSLRFDMESGRTQTIYIMDFDGSIEFSVPSALILEREGDLPHAISTDLLRKSRMNKIGMWVIEEIGGKFAYSLMYNVPMPSLAPDFFHTIIETMILQCEEFDAALASATGQTISSSYGGEFGKGVARGVGHKVGMLAAGTLLSLLLDN